MLSSCVCPSQAGVVPKWLNLVSRKQSVLQNRFVTPLTGRGWSLSHAITPLVDHGEQRPQSSPRTHDGGVSRRGGVVGCLRNELTDGRQAITLRDGLCCTMSPMDISFLMPKVSAKIQGDHPQRGRQIQVGKVEIVDFRPIYSHISEMVHEREYLLSNANSLDV